MHMSKSIILFLKRHPLTLVWVVIHSVSAGWCLLKILQHWNNWIKLEAWSEHLSDHRHSIPVSRATRFQYLVSWFWYIAEGFVYSLWWVISLVNCITEVPQLKPCTPQGRKRVGRVWCQSLLGNQEPVFIINHQSNIRCFASSPTISDVVYFLVWM